MSEAGFHLDGYSVLRLTSTDASGLQDLFERCTDFHELSEGFPTRPTAGAEELVARPAGRDLVDKFSFGIYAPGGELIGYMDLMRNYPAEREWWIGLLLLDPAARGGGLGSRIYRAAAEWVRTQGATVIYLGVLEQNVAAEQFWRREGFKEVRRDPTVSDTGEQSWLLVMCNRPLAVES
jgi:GNAT superfamily N-acetyltransferase